MHLIIVEDLSLDREKLADLIRRDCAGHGESADLSFYDSGEDFLTRYRPKACDGLFLDILLGGLSGIEVARRVREREPRLPIIFTTAERDYAVEGFAVHATDYLMKLAMQDHVFLVYGSATGISGGAVLHFPTENPRVRPLRVGGCSF